jgi:GTPase
MVERGGGELFKQSVDSMQIDYEKVSSAKPGDIIGIKTDEPVKEGSEVFKLQV